MDNKMSDILRSFQLLSGERPMTAEERQLDSALSSRPHTSAAGRATKKIERGLLWVLEHGNWFST
eukprot:CAMPEP_0202838690 /NCGR_PEP_ID=MMETSP1389-20130828/50122_1 /ASSEMBLY_ACC=CAM_ASM_000865 /TAXON_ID=302021 /ORGANISM="Rhodomonas sp., Strain CCMP768" /LENGTH=64 /DNA_ID=CAMNT_0049515019 /DNA_START=18 /DNA_END=212 /DNA_ORIENTATION=+